VICKSLGYNQIDKTAIIKLFKLTEQDLNNDLYLHNIMLKVKQLHEQESKRIKELCEQLQQKWDNYRDKYFLILNKVFDITIDTNAQTHTYCYLQLLPINEVDLKNNIIYLDCNKDIEEIFKTFIIMLTKLILINRWNYTNNWNFNTDFDVKNKIWMFAEIAIDAIFANSDLADITTKPAYKYFYSLNIQNVNTMDKFKNLYPTVQLDEFFTQVYLYVHENYQTLLQFKNYLY